MKLRKLTREEVTFTVDIEPEDMDPRGNVMASGDDAADAEAENDVIDRLIRGDVSAWCCIKVTAQWKGYSHSEYLGGSSFEDGLFGDALRKQVEEHAEWSGMYEEALDGLNAEIAAHAKELEELA